MHCRHYALQTERHGALFVNRQTPDGYWADEKGQRKKLNRENGISLFFAACFVYNVCRDREEARLDDVSIYDAGG